MDNYLDVKLSSDETILDECDVYNSDASAKRTNLSRDVRLILTDKRLIKVTSSGGKDGKAKSATYSLKEVPIQDIDCLDYTLFSAKKLRKVFVLFCIVFVILGIAAFIVKGNMSNIDENTAKVINIVGFVLLGLALICLLLAIFRRRYEIDFYLDVKTLQIKHELNRHTVSSFDLGKRKMKLGNISLEGAANITITTYINDDGLRRLLNKLGAIVLEKKEK